MVYTLKQFIMMNRINKLTRKLEALQTSISRRYVDVAVPFLIKIEVNNYVNI